MQIKVKAQAWGRGDWPARGLLAELGLEGGRRSRRQIRRRVDRVLVDPQLEVQMRARRVSGRSLEPDHRALRDLLADADESRRQVAVQGVQPARVSDHDVVAVPAARAADQRHDPVVGRLHRRSKRLDQVDAGVEVRIAAIGRFEPIGAGPEWLGDLSLRLGPDEAELGRVAAAGWNLAHIVRLDPQLQLRPDRLHGRGDDRVLLLLQHLRDLLRQLRRLCVQARQLYSRLGDLHLQLRQRGFLLRLKALQLRQIRAELVPQLDLLGTRSLFLLALQPQCCEITLQGILDLRGTRSRDVQIRDAGQQVAQALRFGEHNQRRLRRRINRASQLAELRALGLDAPGKDRLAPFCVRDLHVEIGDLRLGRADLALEHALLGSVVLQGLLQLLLSGQCVSQIASELGADLVDDRLLLRRVGRTSLCCCRKTVGAEHEKRKHESDQPPSHVSMCLRRLISDEPEPRPRPTRRTIAAASAATVTVTPGANRMKAPAAAVIPANVRPNVMRPATKPAVAPVIAPSTTNGPRTIQRGAPTSCKIVISSRRAWIAILMLFMVTVTATKASKPRNAMPATAAPNRTAWMRW